MITKTEAYVIVLYGDKRGVSILNHTHQPPHHTTQAMSYTLEEAKRMVRWADEGGYFEDKYSIYYYDAAAFEQDNIILTDLSEMSDENLRQWVCGNANRPGALRAALRAAAYQDMVALAVWLIDEHGAPVNNPPEEFALPPLHHARSFRMVAALLERGADPVQSNAQGYTAIIFHAYKRHFSCVRCLLRYPAARAAINLQIYNGDDAFLAGQTALHIAADHFGAPDDDMINLLLRAGADPMIREEEGRTALDMIETMEWRFQGCTRAGDLLRQAPDAELAALLVRARRLVVLGTGVCESNQRPAHLKNGAKKGKASARVEMVMGVAEGVKKRGGGDGDVGEGSKSQQYEDAEEEGRVHDAVAFLLGLDGPGGKTLPGGVFVRVMDFFMPKWDPLRVGIKVLETEGPTTDYKAMVREMQERAMLWD